MPRVDERRRGDDRGSRSGGDKVSPQENAGGDESLFQEIAGRRRERLAINLFDLERIEPHVRRLLRLGELLGREPIRVDAERPDEVGVEFACDLLQAACLCDVLRLGDRNGGRYPTRVYLHRERAWTRLPGHAVLSVVDPRDADRTGRPEPVLLNPQWFAPLPAELPPPPPAVRVEF